MSDDAIELLETMILLLLGIVFAASLFRYSAKHDKALLAETATKPSIVHSYAYLDEDKKISSAEVFTNILDNEGLYVKVNNTLLDEVKLNKARSGNDACIDYIKNTLNGYDYIMAYEYTEDGNIVGMSFRR